MNYNRAFAAEPIALHGAENKQRKSHHSAAKTLHPSRTGGLDLVQWHNEEMSTATTRWSLHHREPPKSYATSGYAVFELLETVDQDTGQAKVDQGKQQKRFIG